MSLRDEYIEFKESRGNPPFDIEGDEKFCNAQFGGSLGSFCKKIFAELMDIERRLDELEK